MISTIKTIVICLLSLVCLLLIVQYRGYKRGLFNAFNSIILEECKLNEITRDISCVIYIDE